MTIRCEICKHVIEIMELQYNLYDEKYLADDDGKMIEIRLTHKSCQEKDEK